MGTQKKAQALCLKTTSKKHYHQQNNTCFNSKNKSAGIQHILNRD
jgi:hypothetical protein